VFTIQVFNALQTRFGPSKRYLSQKCNPELEMKMSLEVLNIICVPKKPASVGRRDYCNTIAGSPPGERIFIYFEKIRFTSQNLNFSKNILQKN
jgi:hypothetical protein